MNEDPIDLRLRAALRHAPDGDLAPSSVLDQNIKAAARQALARQTPPTMQRRAWRGWLDRLLQPPAAAALATLALGTVVGVMWQGQVPPESMPGAPLASADLPAAVVGTEPKASATVPPMASATVPPKSNDAVPPQPAQAAPPQSSAALPAPANPKPATPVRARVPTTVAEAQEAAPIEQRSASPLMQATAPATTVATAPTPPPAQTPAAAVGPAQAGAQNEVAALISPPAPPQSSEPTAAAAVPRPAAAAAPAAPPAAKARSGLGAPADLARLADRPAAAAVAPEPPPLAELGNAAAGRWQRIASDQMPEGGTFIRDAAGQVLGRRLVERDWLWWQPWINGQPAPQAQRAAARGAASAPPR